MGIAGCEEIEQSLRIKGYTAQLHCRKRPWQPADTLTVAEVQKLHAMLSDQSAPLSDRVVCGHMLHLLYGRARWSDLVHVQGLFVDSDMKYLELDGRSHKGARNADVKSKLLPIASPCLGITEEPWAMQYLEVRSQCGLSEPKDIPMAMLPAPMDGGGLNWGKRHMTSNEGSAFLRMAIGAEKSASRRISTHSLKSTSISWCSKFGLDEGTKALLARHLSAIKNPQALYSRDLLSPVLRAYDQVLAAIRTGMFQPDRTRSGMVCLSEAHLKQYGMVSTTLGIPATPVYQADQPVPATPVPVTPCAPAPLQAGVGAEGSTVDVKSEPFEVLGDLISVHSSPTFDQEEEEIEPVVRDGDCWSESSESSCEESSSEECRVWACLTLDGTLIRSPWSCTACAMQPLSDVEDQ